MNANSLWNKHLQRLGEYQFVSYDEKLEDYVRRWETAKEIMYSHKGGSI